MAQQDAVSPDSQSEIVIQQLLPFDDFLDKIIKQSTTTEGNKLRVEFDRFFNNAEDVYKSYQDSVDRDLEPVNKDYIKNIFSVNSEAFSLDYKYRIRLLEKIKNSRIT